MDDLIRANNDITVQEGKMPEVLYEKVLNIQQSTPDIDFQGIINKMCQYVNITDILDKIKRGTEYVVQIPAEFQGGFESGEYWIMENAKTGKLWPTLMERGEDGRNHIVTPLAIKKQEVIQGNPARDITASYHNLYMQQQINELSGLIETTLDTVKRIEQGQWDDRIGLLNAGKDAFILALAQTDEASRPNAIALAINNISVAQNQIAETYKRRVLAFEPLPNTKLGQFLRECVKTGYLDGKDEEYDKIQECFRLYLQATKMLAGCYAITRDIDNAQRVFDMSIDKIKDLDYSKLKTIEYTHKDEDFDKIYEQAAQYLLEEKQVCLDEAKEYDCLCISVSGDKLLEVMGNGKRETF